MRSSVHDPNSLTIIANYIPLEEPAGGPNFFPFDPDVKYEIKIDNDGDGKSDVTYSFRFDAADCHELRRHPDVPVQRRAGDITGRSEPTGPPDV